MTVLPGQARSGTPGAPARTVGGMPLGRVRRRGPGTPLGVLAGLTALAALAACASGGSGPGATGTGVPPAPPATSPRPVPAPPADQAPPTPSVMDPVAGQRERRLPWTVVRPSAETLVVEVAAGGPPCDAVTGVDVVESADRVAVTVWAGRVPGATGCEGPVPALLGTFWVRVPLAAPLGARAVTPG